MTFRREQVIVWQRLIMSISQIKKKLGFPDKIFSKKIWLIDMMSLSSVVVTQ